MTKSRVVFGVLRNVAIRAIRTAGFVLMAALVAFFCVASARAQNPLPLGTITNIEPIDPPCTVNGSNPFSMAGNTTCYALTVDCSNVDPNLMPLVGTIAVTTPANQKGTIFFHNGGSGDTYFNEGAVGESYAKAYYEAGFQIVQLAWSSEWQGNYSGSPPLEPLLYSSCRPATVVSHVYSHFHQPHTAMCAQGHSAGSAAMAYSLSTYGSYSYLDNVLLTSGPVYAAVQEGCQYPNVVTSVTLCGNDGLGCDTTQSWTDFPQYVNTPEMGKTVSAAQAVAGYTIPGTAPPAANCNNWQQPQNPNGPPTTSAQNMEWKNMSVTSPIAAYNYPQTSLHAYLCGPPTPGNPQNNSAAQGWLFYQNLYPIGSGPILNLLVHRIDDCTGDEMIWGVNAVDNGEGGQSGFMVSMDDMITNCLNNHDH
jgi:hypothetical protein